VRYLVLVLAWITPALVAGMLGWTGIWGTGSALVEYLLPVPVAGGFLHLPSFVAAAGLVLAERRLSESLARSVPAIAAGVLVAALCLALDTERVHAFLFSDHTPRSLVVFELNALHLFIASDAFWVCFYYLTGGRRSPAWQWGAVALVPVAALAFSTAPRIAGTPVFELGGIRQGPSRGDQLHMVYASSPFQEDVFRDWLASRDYFGPPWTSPNSEHVAIVFTDSLEATKRLRYEDLPTIAVGTFCLFEEDRSIHAYAGYHDCFADRQTVEERLADLRRQEPSGLGDDIDRWYAYLRLCDGVELPDQPDRDVARVRICQATIGSLTDRVDRFTRKYGADSPQAEFVRSRVAGRITAP
jgi:hypothetical protein